MLCEQLHEATLGQLNLSLPDASLKSHHVWDAVRDGINMPAVRAGHRAFIYVNLHDADL